MALHTTSSNETRLDHAPRAPNESMKVLSGLVARGRIQAAYEKVLDLAVELMGADHASLQKLHAGRGLGGELELIACRNFSAEGARTWKWIGLDATTTCGIALGSGRQTVARDIETCEFMAGTEHRRLLLEAGIRAAQSTPLISSRGRMVGMLTTHWRRPHEPTQDQLRRFRQLAQQAAAVLEQLL